MDKQESVRSKGKNFHYHGNVWAESDILSLASPYSGFEYRKRAEELVIEVKKFINEKFEKNRHANDLLPTLLLLDAITCLGIQRYFSPEMQDEFDYIYRCLKDHNGIGFGSSSGSDHKQYLTNSLGFMLLRKRGCAVSDDFGIHESLESNVMIPQLCDNEEKTTKKMLYLLRACAIAFEGENIFDNGEAIARAHLTKWLENLDDTNKDSSLDREVRHVMHFPWHSCPPRWKARQYIDILQANKEWLRQYIDILQANKEWPRCKINQKILDLAKLDFNILQAIHQEEMKEIVRWWNKEEIPKFEFLRHRPIESYYYSMLSIFEPDYKDARIIQAKLTMFCYCMDDVSDNYASSQELQDIVEALESWDYSTNGMTKFRDHGGNLFNSYERQGRDMKDYIKALVVEYAKAQLRENVWNERGEIPTLDEYLEINHRSAAATTIILCTMTVIASCVDENFYQHFLRACKLGDTMGRLADDGRELLENDISETNVNVITCYLKQNPRSSTSDALSYAHGLFKNYYREENYWYLMEHDIPVVCKSYCFDVNRSSLFFYTMVDGFSKCSGVIKDQITKTLALQV